MVSGFLAYYEYAKWDTGAHVYIDVEMHIWTTCQVAYKVLKQMGLNNAGQWWSGMDVRRGETKRKGKHKQALNGRDLHHLCVRFRYLYIIGGVNLASQRWRSHHLGQPCRRSLCSSNDFSPSRMQECQSLTEMKPNVNRTYPTYPPRIVNVISQTCSLDVRARPRFYDIKHHFSYREQVGSGIVMGAQNLGNEISITCPSLSLPYDSYRLRNSASRSYMSLRGRVYYKVSDEVVPSRKRIQRLAFRAFSAKFLCQI